MDDLLQEFIAETRETLAALASEIVAWEADPADRARLDAIFRFVHTVKGSCGFLDLPRLARLSHAAEDVLSAVRDGRRAPDAGLVNAVLAIVDRIGEIVEAIDAGASLADSGEELLIAALTADAMPTGPTPSALPATGAAPRAPSRSVRLPVDLLDRMMNGMSDMVLARNELARRLREGDADPASEAALERLSLTVADMRDAVSRTRMQTIDALFSALPRIVRDTATALGKQVALTIAGADVEIDREMVEMMRDPLVHIVRNAIDHGIEPPAARRAAGKLPTGQLTVSARQSGNTIVIEVSDDGRGIDTARLATKAARTRDASVVAALSERARLELIFEPGLSSRDEVTEVSGRGVGMDVVRANVEQIGGRIELDNRPERGLAVVIHVPLTLSILPTIVFGAGEQRFAIARQAIDEVVALRGDAVRVDALGGGHVATLRGERLAVVDLPALLGLAAADPAARAMLAIVAVPGGRFALAVDSVLDSEELVIKPAAPGVMTSGLFAGQTLPDTGVPMLVLDASGIASAQGIAFARRSEPPPVAAEAAPTGIEALLIVDLDGARRALPLGSVDRIEAVERDRFALVGGRLRLSGGGRIVPAVARGPLPASHVTVVRLRDGTSELGYAVRAACEIVTLTGEIAPSASVDTAGVALHEGSPIELIDVHHLFADLGTRAAQATCVLAGNSHPWLATFLAPVLESAGYRVVTTPTADAITLAMEGDDLHETSGGAVVRLSEHRGGAGIFRYDRGAVLAALAAAR